MELFAVYAAALWDGEGWVWVGGQGGAEDGEGGCDEVGREVP